MNIPEYLQQEIVKEDRYPTEAFSNFLRNLLQSMQLSISEEGYWIPSISSEPNSAGPGLTQLGVLEASFQTDVVNDNTQTVTTGVQAGTIIFDPYEVNGGGGMTPRLGQLKVLLRDGTFHAIVNL